MKRKSKLIVRNAIIIIAILSLGGWYLYPYLMNKWYMFSFGALRQLMEIKPTYVKKLLSPPTEWDGITIGDLRLKIPLSDVSKIINHGTSIFFIFKSGTTLAIIDVAPAKELVQLLEQKQLDYPTIPYSQKLAIVNSTPSDISILNKRSANSEAFANQILKTIGMQVLTYEVSIVNANGFKAVCEKSKKEEYGYMASAYIYSPNEAMSFTIMLMRYQDKDKLDTDLLTMLGGMEVPVQPQSIDIVEKDIQKIVDRFQEKI